MVNFDVAVSFLIPICSLIGIAWAAILWKRVASVKVSGGVSVRGNNGGEYLLEEEQRGDEEVKTPLFP
jgi:inorganic pyrophosphatase